MSTVPYFQFYPSDYLADTGHLTTEQHGAYLLMLITAWARGGRLPNDAKKLARIARVSPRRWHLVGPDVLEFWTEDGDDIVSERMERDYEKAVSKSEKRSASGKRGGEAKALKTKKPSLANATGLLKHLPEPELKREAKASPKKATRLPDDWVLSRELGEWALSEGLPEDRIRIEAERFKDYWLGVGGAKARKADWPATWRNWCRKAIDDLPKRSPNKPKGDPNGKAGRLTRAAQALAEGRTEAGSSMAGDECRNPDRPLLAGRGGRGGVSVSDSQVVRLPLGPASGSHRMGDQRASEAERPPQADHRRNTGGGFVQIGAAACGPSRN
jgi:uncharacterized protein YdaU (DUF1376 family)